VVVAIGARKHQLGDPLVLTDFAPQAMKDPHVQSLYYSVVHPKNVHYEKAEPISRDTPAFTVRIENGRCEVTMKTHHATVGSARAEVEPFLRAWEMTAALEFVPQELRFFFHDYKIIDRDALEQPPRKTVRSTVNVPIEIVPQHVTRSKYPEPPTGIARDTTVDLMFREYCHYRYTGGHLELRRTSA
jgi:hypothetical protein